MRTSNIILLSVFLLACVSALSLALTARYKVNHHLYTTVDRGSTVSLSLSPFSEVFIENEDNVTIRKGDVNSISWQGAQHDSAAIFSVDRGVLSLHDTISGHNEVVVTATSLDKVRLHHADQCAINGFNQDSLSVFWIPRDTSGNDRQNTALEIDSSDIQRLRLEGRPVISVLTDNLMGENTVSISHSHIAGLWFYSPDNLDITLDNTSLGWIRGYWGGDVRLSMDAASSQVNVQRSSQILVVRRDTIK